MAGATWHFGEDFIADLKNMFEAVNVKKDQLVLDAIIKPYWPESITPNHLTLVRIVIGAALFILLFNFRIESGLIVLPLFFIGILTDLLDGVIARGMDKETALGIFLDPVADRILLVPIAIYSLLGPSALLLVAFLFFEVINAGISLYADSRNVSLGTNIFGKAKMFLQSVVFMGILLFWPMAPNIFFIYLLWLSMALLLMSLYAKIVQLKAHK